jgi:GT2 family glycosyltransferase
MFARLLLRGNTLGTSAVTIKKEILEQLGGFDERADFFCVEDYDLWMRAARAQVEFYFLSDVLGEYRLHESNASEVGGGEHPERFHLHLRRVLEENFRHLPSPRWSERRQHRRNIANTYFFGGVGLLKRKKCFQALEHFSNCLLQDPMAIPDHLIRRIYNSTKT